MKLAAVYNTWGDWELLEVSVNNIAPMVDMVIVIHSLKSNYGETDPRGDFGMWTLNSKWPTNMLFVTHNPTGFTVMEKETNKRNYGLNLARDCGATHYLSCDADELYDPEEFKENILAFRKNDALAGLVCKSRVYFSRPTLTIGLDTTLVPFIHKITSTIRHEFNRNYPFAWEGKNIRIDPTRSFNIDSGVEMSPIVLEHFSWVRKDLEAYKRKIRNSTARANLERSNILQDLLTAKEGEMCHFYGKRLVRVPNRFNIPYGESLEQDIQPGTSADA